MGPKREDRLNPMSRRKGRPPAAPPGPEWMVLGAMATCPTCGWVGLEMDDDGAAIALADHNEREHKEEQ